MKQATVTWTQNFRIFNRSTLASFNIQYTYMKVLACYYDTHIFFWFNKKITIRKPSPYVMYIHFWILLYCTNWIDQLLPWWLINYLCCIQMILLLNSYMTTCNDVNMELALVHVDTENQSIWCIKVIVRTVMVHFFSF